MPSPSLALLRTQSDDRLVALARDGHDRAFEAIVERYRRPLLRACRRILPEARAEDALQQAFLDAWNGLRRGDPVTDLRPWLYRIARNSALNQLRLRGYDYEELVESLGEGGTASEEHERRAVVRQTLASIATLPERQREALLRTALEGDSQEEVARDLGLTTGAVRQLVHRARVRLRAAATAVIPLPLAGSLAHAASRPEPITWRIAELVAGASGAGLSATIAKTGVVAVVAGGVVTSPGLLGGDAPSAVKRPVEASAETTVRGLSTGTAARVADLTDSARPAKREIVPGPVGTARPVSFARGDGDDGGGAKRRTVVAGGERGPASRREEDEPDGESTPSPATTPDGDGDGERGPGGGDKPDKDDGHKGEGEPEDGDDDDKPRPTRPDHEDEDNSGPSRPDDEEDEPVAPARPAPEPAPPTTPDEDEDDDDDRGASSGSGSSAAGDG